jgi:hypothetical protein
VTLRHAKADINTLLHDREQLIAVLKQNMVPTVAMSTMTALSPNPPPAIEFYKRILQNQLGITIALIQLLEVIAVPFEMPPNDGSDEDRKQ